MLTLLPGIVPSILNKLDQSEVALPTGLILAGATVVPVVKNSIELARKVTSFVTLFGHGN